MERQPEIVSGDLRVDLKGRRVTVAGRECALTAKEFDLLSHLARHPGWVWSRQQLLETVWGYEIGDLHVVGVHLANLRRKLGDDPGSPRFIHTVRGAGYRFEDSTAHASSGAPEEDSGASPRETPWLQSEVFVGRIPEMAALRAGLEAATAGAGRVVMVTGEVGIGKTRLAEEFARETAAKGIPVLWGTCREHGAAPWEPWPEIVDACLSLPDVSGGVAAARLPLFGQTRESAAGSAGSEGHERAREDVIREIGLVLAHVAVRTPMVIILDDVHWAGTSALLCLRHLTREAQSRRWLVVATCRDFEVLRSPLLGEVIGDVARMRGETLRLRPLGEADVARLVAQCTDRSPFPALVTAVRQITAGNAFFVRELLHLLVLRDGDASAIADLPWQEGVRQVIGRRVGALSADCVRLLELAATIGLRFSALLVERASGLPVERCAGLLDEAEAAQVLRAVEAREFAFAHQLVRDVVYLGLSSTQRGMLHARVGAALESLWAADVESHAAELAHHFGGAGDAHSAARAFSYAILAGRQALARYAWEEAARWLEKALEVRRVCPGCVIEAPDLASLYEDLGDAHFDAGHVDHAAQAFDDSLRANHDSSLLDTARRYRKLGGALVLTPHVTRATLAYEEADRVMGEPTPDRSAEWWQEWLTVELERCWGYYYGAEFAKLTHLAEYIRTFVDERGSAAHRGAFYNCLWIGDEGVNRYVTTRRGLELALDSEAGYRTASDPRQRYLGQWAVSLALLWLPEHPEEAESHLRRYFSLAEELGEVTDQLEALWGLAMWHRWHGHIGKVRELADQSLALNAGRDVGCYSPCAQGNLAWVAYRAGDFERAGTLAREALSTIERDEEHVMAFQWHMRWPLLGVSVSLGDLDQAVTQATALLRPSQQAMPAALERTLAAFLASPSAETVEPAFVLAHRHGYL
jgi:eukaryotic-like serine/threonine-protein kinase